MLPTEQFLSIRMAGEKQLLPVEIEAASDEDRHRTKPVVNKHPQQRCSID
jgi:hypothetical protein